MKVTEKNKERLLEEYVSLIYMSTQIVNPAWNHHIKPTIEIIQRLPHKALESQYALTLESIVLIRKECNILLKILHNESFEPYSLKNFCENFERISEKEIKRKLSEKEKIAIFRRAARKKTKKEIKVELIELVGKLKALGFRKTKNGKYIKKVNDGKFEVIPILGYKNSSFKYIDKEYIVYIEPVRQTYMFVNKKNLRIGIAYDRALDETTYSRIDKNNRLSIIECPKRIKKKIDNYIDIIDKEFRHITKPNFFWFKEFILKEDN